MRLTPAGDIDAYHFITINLTAQPNSKTSARRSQQAICGWYLQ
jgi:hypothetical protein